LDFEVLEYPYSLDLALSDYHLVEPFKDVLRDSRFAMDKEVVHKWLHDQPKTFFSNSISKLVNRWKKCIEKETM